MKLTVTFLPENRTVAVPAGSTILEAARSAATDAFGWLEAPCGGRGICGRCLVRIVSGDMAPPTETERRMLDPAGPDSGIRLACQATPRSAVTLEVLPEALGGRADLQLDGETVTVPIDPLVKRCTLRLRASTLESPVSCWEQVTEALSGMHGPGPPKIDEYLIRQADRRPAPKQ